MTRVFLFPGQGSQHVGMGQELFGEFPELMAEADAELGYSVAELCLENTGQRLGRTQYTQPAIYVVSALAYYKALREGGGGPDFVAGHSVGEYAALLAAEVFDFRTGLRLVRKRGELMSQVVGGGMAAVVGLTPLQVERVLREPALEGLDVANVNSPRQTVIAGPSRDIREAEQAFRDAGAERYFILNVSGAFHSRYMRGVKDEFRAFLDDFYFSRPRLPVLSNVTARPYEDLEIKANMAMQIVSPVRWLEAMTFLLGQPSPEFREVGPGSVLTKLVRSFEKEGVGA